MANGAIGAQSQCVLYGFHRSTYVSVARLVMHAKGVPFQFHDVENDVYTEAHLRRHPFRRVPALADFFLLPILTALGFASEGRERLDRLPRVMAWTRAMGELPEGVAFRATLPPRAPIEHARRWATEHRPGVRST